MHLSRTSWQHWPLRVKFTIVITIVAAISVLAATMLFIYSEQASHREELQHQAELLLSALEVTSSDALYLLNADFLEDLVEDLADAHDDIFAAVYDSEGRLIADAQTSQSLIYMMEPDPLGQQLVAQSDTIKEWQPDFLLVGKPVKVGRIVIGAISLKLSTQPLDTEINRARNRSIGVALGSAAVSALLALWLSRSLTRPLNELAKATERIIAADFDYQIPVDGGDEVAALTIGFNRMTSQVQGFIQYLEQLVLVRTQELATAMERSETILNHSMDGILLTHADLSIQQTNLAFNRLFNSQPDTYINRSLLDLIITDDTEQMHQILRDKISTHTRHRMETRARRQDGTTFDVELSIGLIKGYGLVCTLRDITERKQAEAVLAAKIQQEREFQAYLKALHDVSIELTQIDDLNTFYQRAVELGLEQLGFERLALFLRNADDGTASGTYGTDQQGQLVDERHVRFTLTPGGIMERAFMRAERFYMDEAVPLYNNLEVVGTGWNAASILWNGIESQGWFVCDNLLTKKPASKVQMEILFLYSMTVGTLLAQKQTQSALVESEARYRLMTENISDVITKVRPDGIRTFSSPSCYALFGYTPEELTGVPILDLVHPDDRAYVQAKIQRTFDEAQSSWTVAYRARHKDGHFVWIEATTNVVRDPHTGEVIDVVGVIRDITERKAAEEALKALHEITIELTQVDDLDEFYQRAVEFGRTRLGFERLALFLYDEQSGLAQGTFGTDRKGHITDERQMRFVPQPDGIMMRAFKRVERFCYDADVPLFSDLKLVGIGWNAATVLGNGTRNIGWLVADNLLSQTPASKSLLDMLGLYGLAIGTLLAQKQTQSALRESEERFRQFAENIDQIVYIRSGDDQKLLYINPAYEKLWGQSCNSLYADPFSFIKLIHPEDKDDVHRQLTTKQYIETGRADFEYRIITPDGNLHWMRAHTFPITGIDGTLSRRGGIVEDITEHKQAQDRLAEERNLLRRLIDTIPEHIYVKDTNHRFVLTNVALARSHGCDTPEAMIGKSDHDILPRELADAYRVAEDAIFQTGQPQIDREEPSTEYDGGFEWALSTKMPLYNLQDELIGLVGINRDITGQKAIERQMRFDASIQASVSDAVVVTDMNFIIQSWNAAAEAIYGWSAAEVIGKSSSTILPISFEPGVDSERIQQEFYAQGVWQGEGIQRHKNGHKLHSLISINMLKDEEGTPIGIIGVSRDISERKQVEETLRASEEKYRHLVETMRGGLAIYDPDDRIMYVNDRFCQLLGYQREELIGTRSYDYVDETYAALIGEHLDLRRDAESTSYEITVKHKQGQPVHLLVSGAPLLDENQVYNGSFAVMTDISLQKQAEALLRQALAKEQELGELKTRFVSMASHEFRTPLATILALTETIIAYREKLSSEQVDQRLGKIQTQVEHLKNIMEDVLQLARIQARRERFNPAMLDLDGLCLSVLDEFQDRPDIQNRLIYTCEGKTSRDVKLDKRLMRQIINNLVSNAIKYSPADMPVMVHLQLEAEAVILTVQDSGIGIPEDGLKHLFEPFHRAANVGTISGTGLGLVITKESVEMHGGTITVDSQVNVGTTFVVSIPIAVGE